MKKTQKKFGKSLYRFLKFFDLYGQNVNLFIDKKPKFYTTCSGLISMAVIAFIIFTFIGFINSWLNNEKMTPIPSSISKSVLELLSENKNYEYDFGYQNYPFYWSFFSVFPNGTQIPGIYLKNYFTYKITYLDENLNSKELLTEPCKIDQQDIFLGFDQTKIEQDAGKTSVYRICIKNNYKMGTFPNNTRSTVLQPYIYFSFFQCVNSTDNKNSCAAQEAIDEMIKYTTVQATVPTTLYDFKNTKKSQKNVYDYRNTKIEKSMVKFYKNQIITTNLYMDDGLLYDDYQLQSTNFNPNIDYDPFIRNNSVDPLYMFVYTISFNTQNYYLRNQKINEIAGNLGGLINAIFLIGKLICIAYNSIYLKFKIIRTTFEFSSTRKQNLEISPNNMRESIINSKTSLSSKITRGFSYCSYLFPSKEVRMFYQKGSKYLYEYIDIRKIIKRLQDLDKLKMILLTEDQRKLFEYIPKPDVVHSVNKFSLQNINRFAKNLKNAKTSNTAMKSIDKNDPINLRILDCLDANMKVEQENFGGSYYFFIYYFLYFRNYPKKQ